MGEGSQNTTVVSATSYAMGTAGGEISTQGMDTVTVHANGPGISVTGGMGRLIFTGGTGVDTIMAGGDVTVQAGSGTLLYMAGGGNAAITTGSGKKVFDTVNHQADGMLLFNTFNPALDTFRLDGGVALKSVPATTGGSLVTLTDTTRISMPGLNEAGTRKLFS